jgi:chromosome segregation ATPase
VTPLQAFFAAAGLILTCTGLVLAYAYPGWKHRRETDESIRQVLVGDPGDPEQGLEARHGIGKRITDVEGNVSAMRSDVAEIKRLVNGGGLGSQMQGISQQLIDHVAEAAGDRASVIDEQRQLRADLTDAVAVLTANQERIRTQLGDQVAGVEEKVDQQLADAMARVEHLTAALGAYIHEDADGSDGGGG